MARKITFPTFFPRVFGVQYFGQGFVSNLPIKGLSAPYSPSIMAIGERIYSDSTHLITESHFDFKKVSLVKTFSSHKNSTDTKEILIQAREPMRVWVAYDEKGSSELPTWLKQKFKRTGYRIKSNQGVEFQLYKLDMRAGEVTLGGNAKGVRRPGNQYFVILENLHQENVVVTRDVTDTTVDEIKYTSDNLIQLFSKGMLVHNVWVDPGFDLYLNNNQFEQNGLSILNVGFSDEVNLVQTSTPLGYDVVTSGPVVTGNTVIFKYQELINGVIVTKERIDPVIIPAQTTHHTTTEIINTTAGYDSFEERVDKLNIGVIPFVPTIENFIPAPYQPGTNQSFLSFTPQESLVNPDIEIYGSNFINPDHETTLFWESTNASRISLDKKEIDFKGWVNVSPSSTTSYIFEVEADEELLTKNYVVQVVDNNVTALQPLPSLKFKTDKKVVDAGQSITLTWKSTDATHVYLDNIAVGLSGSSTFVVDDNTEFTLKGSNPYMEVFVSLFIRITPEIDLCS